MLYLKVSKGGSQSDDDAKATCQKIADLLGVCVELSSHPYGFTIVPSGHILEAGPESNNVITMARKCDCGGVGGHSPWCATRN